VSEKLPASWAWSELKDITEIGPKFDAHDLHDTELVHFVPMAAVAENFGGIDVSQLRPLNEVRKGYTFFAEGDVLFAKITPCMENGKGALVPHLARNHAFGSTEFHVLRPSKAISEKWLAHFVSQPSFRKTARHHMTGTAGQLRVPTKWLQAVRMPIPPRAEQTRIVAKLEELLSDLDAGVAELKAAQKKLQQYRQSLLKAAVEGALTAPWREAQRAANTPLETGAELLERILRERRARWEEKQLAKFKEQGKTPPKDWQKKYPEPVVPDTPVPALPEGWGWATIDQLTIEQRYGSSAKTNENSSGIAVLRMGNIQDGQLDLTHLKYLPKGHEEFPALFLKDGDLLFNRTNSPELVGKTAVYRSELTPCSYASYLIAVSFAESFVPEFASAYINSAYGRHWVKSVVVQQVGQANVNGSKLAALSVPLPPLAEQIELMRALAEQIESAFAQEKNIEKSLKQSTAQRQNILRAAFAGRLVPQDPDDEPGSVLLERIRSESAAQAATKKPRGRKTEGVAA
jgi:type I restriction enzyme, S subunit